MRMDKLTTKFQMALADAQSLAVGRDHQFIEPVHLLSALLDQEGGSVTYLLAQANVNTNALRSQLGDALDRLPRVEGVEGDVQISNELGRLLNVTDKLAQKRNDQYISSELFVLAATQSKDQLGKLLGENGATAAVSSKRSRRCAAASASTTPTPRSSARRSRSTPSTSPSVQSRASSTR